MKLYAWAVLVGGLGGGLLTAGVDGVRGQAAPAPLIELKQNYPNPFNPATTIPFILSGDLFANGHRPKVSLTIYNVLAQVVAVPILQGSGEKLTNRELTCTPVAGACSFPPYWNGACLDTDVEAAPGL